MAKFNNFIALGLFVFALLMPQIVAACSVTRDFVRPSNFKLVQLADVIAIVTPIKQTRLPDDDAEVTFRIDNLIKGEANATFTTKEWGRLGNTSPSDPDDISSAHPEAYSGSCSRRTYKKGRQYVFFLKRNQDGELSVGINAFSRDSEDYHGEDSLWMRTIRYYLKVQAAHQPMQQLEVLKTRYEELTASEMTPQDEKLAADIADHLMSRSPNKPTQYLLQTYAALDAYEELPFAVRGPEANREGSQAERMTDLIYGQRDEPGFGARQQEQSILWALVNGDHPTAMGLFTELAENPNQQGKTLGAVVRFYSKHDRYRDAVEIANSNAFRVLNSSPRRDVDEFLRGVLAMHRYEGDYERE